jgi:hypothetical protein
MVLAGLLESSKDEAAQCEVSFFVSVQMIVGFSLPDRDD